MKIRSLIAAVCPAVALSGPACAGYIIDTGTPVGGPSGWSLGNYQYFGGEFTVADSSVISSIEGYFSTFEGGNMDFPIHADGGNVPGAILFTTPSAIAANTALGWHGVSGLSWALAAGTYWVSFHVDGGLDGIMPGFAPNPLGEYAVGFGNYAWRDYGANAYDYLDIGVRIAASVPEPSTTLLLLFGIGFVAMKSGRPCTGVERNE